MLNNKAECGHPDVLGGLGVASSHVMARENSTEHHEAVSCVGKVFPRHRT